MVARSADCGGQSSAGVEPRIVRCFTIPKGGELYRPRPLAATKQARRKAGCWSAFGRGLRAYASVSIWRPRVTAVETSIASAAREYILKRSLP